MQKLMPITSMICSVVFMLCSAVLVQAAGLFGPAIKVNNALVSNYDVAQRAALFELINQPGSYEDALDSMVSDVLKRTAASDAGIVVPDETKEALVQRFVSSTPLSPDEALARAIDAGVDPQTISRFVETQFMWEQLVRQRFSRQLSLLRQDDTSAALAPRGFIEVNLSEIALPLIPGQEQELLELAEELRFENSFDTFARNARQFSAAPSREDGGAMGWIKQAGLAPVVQEAIAGLSIGEVSAPVTLPQAVVLVRYNGKRENILPRPAVASLTYLEILSENKGTQGDLQSSLQRCDDIYGFAQELSDISYAFHTRVPSQIPAEQLIALERLDENEVTSNGHSLLMLCTRIYDIAPAEDQDVSVEMADMLNTRLNALAEGYLAELRADALISK